MILRNLPFSKYRELPELNNSSLSELTKSPLHFKLAREGNSPDTPSTIWGRLVHTLLLEPDEFDREFAVLPSCDRRTKKGKEIYDEFCTNLDGDRTVITERQYETASVAVEHAMNNPAIESLILGSVDVELTITGKLFGVPFKVRLDSLGSDSINDVKTTKDVSERSFASSIKTFGYHRQAAAYLTLLSDEQGGAPVNFYFIAIQNAEPFTNAVYELDSASIAQGRRELLRLISRYKQLNVTHDYHPMIHEGIRSIGLSRWDFDEDDREESNIIQFPINNNE